MNRKSRFIVAVFKNISRNKSRFILVVFYKMSRKSRFIVVVFYKKSRKESIQSRCISKSESTRESYELFSA